MSRSMRDALLVAGLVEAHKAKAAEERERARLRAEEARFERQARARGYEDETDLIKQERFMRGAAHEGRNAASKVGTRAYYDRFKK